MFELLPTLAVLLGLFVCALIGGAIASGRDRDGAVWFVVCLLLGPLPIVGLLLFGNDARAHRP